MHSGGLHLQGRQFLHRFIRQDAVLHAQHLAQLHRRTFQRPQFLPHAPGCLPLETRPPFRQRLFAQQKILGLVSQIAAHEADAEFAEPETAGQRAVPAFGAHHSQPPCFRKCPPSFRHRSSRASVCSLPRERSRSQCVVIAR